jgi:hypothetical protein
MKFIIVGPSDTPYEYGLYEFDLWCGPNYPQTPPNILFKTAGSGYVKLNRSLHADGKGKARWDVGCIVLFH